MDENKTYLLYISEIRRYPLLSFNEELDLAQKISLGDTKAREKLINSNLRLVVSIAHKFKNPQMLLMDLIQEGNLGLITAVNKYSDTFNVRFSTYAFLWISQSINRALLNKKRIIKLPHRKEEMMIKIQKACAALNERLTREATYEEIAIFLSIPIHEVCELLSYPISMISMDSQIDENFDFTIADIIPDIRYNPEEQVLSDSRRTFSHTLLKTLPLRERLVLRYRYNLDYDEKPKTLQQIGHNLGISTETVRQTELRAMKRLQQNKMEFIEYSL